MKSMKGTGYNPPKNMKGSQNLNLNRVTANENIVSNVQKIPSSTGFQSNPVHGQFFYKSDDRSLRVWDSSLNAWRYTVLG